MALSVSAFPEPSASSSSPAASSTPQQLIQDDDDHPPPSLSPRFRGLFGATSTPNNSATINHSSPTRHPHRPPSPSTISAPPQPSPTDLPHSFHQQPSPTLASPYSHFEPLSQAEYEQALQLGPPLDLSLRGISNRPALPSLPPTVVSSGRLGPNVTRQDVTSYATGRSPAHIYPKPLSMIAPPSSALSFADEHGNPRPLPVLPVAMGSSAAPNPMRRAATVKHSYSNAIPGSSKHPNALVTTPPASPPSSNLLAGSGPILNNSASSVIGHHKKNSLTTSMRYQPLVAVGAPPLAPAARPPLPQPPSLGSTLSTPSALTPQLLQTPSVIPIDPDEHDKHDNGRSPDTSTSNTSHIPDGPASSSVPTHHHSHPHFHLLPSTPSSGSSSIPLLSPAFVQPAPQIEPLDFAPTNPPPTTGFPSTPANPTAIRNSLGGITTGPPSPPRQLPTMPANSFTRSSRSPSPPVVNVAAANSNPSGAVGPSPTAFRPLPRIPPPAISGTTASSQLTPASPSPHAPPPISRSGLSRSHTIAGGRPRPSGHNYSRSHSGATNSSESTSSSRIRNLHTHSLSLGGGGAGEYQIRTLPVASGSSPQSRLVALEDVHVDATRPSDLMSKPETVAAAAGLSWAPSSQQGLLVSTTTTAASPSASTTTLTNVGRNDRASIPSTPAKTALPSISSTALASSSPSPSPSPSPPPQQPSHPLPVLPPLSALVASSSTPPLVATAATTMATVAVTIPQTPPSPRRMKKTPPPTSASSTSSSQRTAVPPTPPGPRRPSLPIIPIAPVQVASSTKTYTQLPRRPPAPRSRSASRQRPEVVDVSGYISGGGGGGYTSGGYTSGGYTSGGGGPVGPRNVIKGARVRGSRNRAGGLALGSGGSSTSSAVTQNQGRNGADVGGNVSGGGSSGSRGVVGVGKGMNAGVLSMKRALSPPAHGRHTHGHGQATSMAISREPSATSSSVSSPGPSYANLRKTSPTPPPPPPPSHHPATSNLPSSTNATNGIPSITINTSAGAGIAVAPSLGSSSSTSGSGSATASNSTPASSATSPGSAGLPPSLMVAPLFLGSSQGGSGSGSGSGSSSTTTVSPGTGGKTTGAGNATATTHTNGVMNGPRSAPLMGGRLVMNNAVLSGSGGGGASVGSAVNGGGSAGAAGGPGRRSLPASAAVKGVIGTVTGGTGAATNGLKGNQGSATPPAATATTLAMMPTTTSVTNRWAQAARSQQQGQGSMKSVVGMKTGGVLAPTSKTTSRSVPSSPKGIVDPVPTRRVSPFNSSSPSAPNAVTIKASSSPLSSGGRRTLGTSSRDIHRAREDPADMGITVLPPPLSTSGVESESDSMKGLAGKGTRRRSRSDAVATLALACTPGSKALANVLATQGSSSTPSSPARSSRALSFSDVDEALHSHPIDFLADAMSVKTTPTNASGSLLFFHPSQDAPGIPPLHSSSAGLLVVGASGSKASLKGVHPIQCLHVNQHPPISPLSQHASDDSAASPLSPLEFWVDDRDDWGYERSPSPIRYARPDVDGLGLGSSTEEEGYGVEEEGDVDDDGEDDLDNVRRRERKEAQRRGRTMFTTHRGKKTTITASPYVAGTASVKQRAAKTSGVGADPIMGIAFRRGMSDIIDDDFARSPPSSPSSRSSSPDGMYAYAGKVFGRGGDKSASKRSRGKAMESRTSKGNHPARDGAGGSPPPAFAGPSNSRDAEKEKKERERLEKERKRKEKKVKKKTSYLDRVGTVSAATSLASSMPDTRASSPDGKANSRQTGRLAEAVTMALEKGRRGVGNGTGSTHAGGDASPVRRWGKKEKGSGGGTPQLSHLGPSTNLGAGYHGEEVLDITAPSFSSKRSVVGDASRTRDPALDSTSSSGQSYSGRKDVGEHNKHFMWVSSSKPSPSPLLPSGPTKPSASRHRRADSDEFPIDYSYPSLDADQGQHGATCGFVPALNAVGLSTTSSTTSAATTSGNGSSASRRPASATSAFTFGIASKKKRTTSVPVPVPGVNSRPPVPGTDPHVDGDSEGNLAPFGSFVPQRFRTGGSP